MTSSTAHWTVSKFHLGQLHLHHLLLVARCARSIILQKPLRIGNASLMFCMGLLQRAAGRCAAYARAVAKPTLAFTAASAALRRACGSNLAPLGFPAARSARSFRSASLPRSGLDCGYFFQSFSNI